MRFAERLKMLMDDKQISNRELARKIGTSHVSVGKWLQGVTLPTDENLEELSKYFQVTPAFLRYGSNSLSLPQTLEPDDDTVSIPVLDVKGSCGYGQFSQSIGLVRMLRVAKQWLLAKAVASISFPNLHIITADGDSMTPAIHRGDFVIVDTSQNQFVADGMYAVQYSNSIFIKRVQVLPGGKISLISDNPIYKPIILDSSEPVEIIGRAVLCFNVREL